MDDIADDALAYGTLLDELRFVGDVPRTDCPFKDFHGHRFIRKAIDLPRRCR